MYTYPNKIEPYLKIIGEKILIVGAFTLPGKDTNVLAVLADLDKGVFKKIFVPDRNLTYVSAAYNMNTKILSIACLNSILFLDENFTEIGISYADFIPWNSLEWQDDSTIWIGGRVKGDVRLVNHPIMALLDYGSLKDIGCFIFREENIYDNVLIKLIAEGVFFLYSHSTSERNDCTDQTEVVVRKYFDETLQTYRFQPKEIIMDNLRFLKVEENIYVLVEQGSQSIWVLNF